MKGLLKNSTSEDTEHDVYRLALNKPSEDLVKELCALDGVISVETFEDEENCYKITFNKEFCSTNKLLAVIIDNKEVEVIEFKEDLKHLNEAFMNLTEAGVREK